MKILIQFLVILSFCSCSESSTEFSPIIVETLENNLLREYIIPSEQNLNSEFIFENRYDSITFAVTKIKYKISESNNFETEVKTSYYDSLNRIYKFRNMIVSDSSCITLDGENIFYTDTSSIRKEIGRNDNNILYRIGAKSKSEIVYEMPLQKLMYRNHYVFDSCVFEKRNVLNLGDIDCLIFYGNLFSIKYQWNGSYFEESSKMKYVINHVFAKGIGKIHTEKCNKSGCKYFDLKKIKTTANNG